MSLEENLKNVPNDPRKNINAHLVLRDFSPTNYRGLNDSIQTKFTIENTGNVASYNAVVAIYFGRTGQKLSKFECVSSFKFTLYPGESVTTKKEIELKEVPLLSKFPPPHLPGSSKAVLLAVCFDPFLMSADKSLKIRNEVIKNIENDYIAGGYYIYWKATDNERSFIYKKIK